MKKTVTSLHLLLHTSKSYQLPKLFLISHLCFSARGLPVYSLGQPKAASRKRSSEREGRGTLGERRRVRRRVTDFSVLVFLSVGCQLLEFRKELPKCSWLQIHHACPSTELERFHNDYCKSLRYRSHPGLQQN